jgi:hypothetical protein
LLTVLPPPPLMMSVALVARKRSSRAVRLKIALACPRSFSIGRVPFDEDHAVFHSAAQFRGLQAARGE